MIQIPFVIQQSMFPHASCRKTQFTNNNLQNQIEKELYLNDINDLEPLKIRAAETPNTQSTDKRQNISTNCGRKPTQIAAEVYTQEGSRYQREQAANAIKQSSKLADPKACCESVISCKISNRPEITRAQMQAVIENTQQV